LFDDGNEHMIKTEGAFYALEMAKSEPEYIRSVVVFYGAGGGDFSAAQAAFLGHFAENDPFEPRSSVDALEEMLRDAGRPVSFYHYPGTGHWFFESDRADAYDPVAGSLAWERTLAFLQKNMG
jgi:carboxymethylenebutenolidase